MKLKVVNPYKVMTRYLRMWIHDNRLVSPETGRFVTSGWDTSVGYFRTENYSGLLFSTFMLVSSVRWHGYLWTSGWLLPCVPRFITTRTGCLRL